MLHRFKPTSLCHYALIGYCATAAISIALSQIFVIFTLLVWFSTFIWRTNDNERPTPADDGPRRLAVPLAYWVGASCLAAILGVDVGRAVPEVLKSSLYVLLPFALWSIFANESAVVLQQRIYAYLVALLFGQTIGSLHSLLSAALGYELRPRVPGPVTESGQLVLILPLALGLLLLRRKELVSSNPVATFLSAGAVSFAMFIAAWPEVFHLERNTRLFHLLVGLGAAGIVTLSVMLLLHLFRIRAVASHSPSEVPQLSSVLTVTVLALLLATLVINLKRGPWIGVLSQVLLIGLFVSRRVLISAVLGAALVLLVFSPVRTRLERYREDFSIGGGRKFMWELGSELAIRYPLGLGPNNAAFMRTLEPSIPPEHRHMHNNLLNVTVESGWIGLCAYVWWMAVVIMIGVKTWLRGRRDRDPVVYQSALLAFLASVSLCGWQIAGGVEYNFGDGEIRMLAFFLMGVILLLRSKVAQLAVVPSPKSYRAVATRPALSTH